jgi:hypothetical protein
MNDKVRVYYYFIFASYGSLTGWFIAALCLRRGIDLPVLHKQVIFGAILGALVGLAIAAYDGVTSQSVIRFIKFGAIGLLLGTLAGAVALPLAEWMNLVLPYASPGAPRWQSFAIRTLCWVLFGGVIGFGESVSKGAQSVKGLAGGSLGGLVGGGLLELARASDMLRDEAEEQTLFAICLTVLGGSIGGSIALVTTTLKRAWFEVVDGKFAERNLNVTKFVSPKSRKVGIIGSDQWSSNIYLPGDNSIMPEHAEIGLVNGVPTLKVMPEAEKTATTSVNGKQITSWPLNNRDRVKIGTTTLIYRQKRK